MSTQEARDAEKRRKLFDFLKPTFPTIVSVLETSDERSRLDRAENKRKREEALRTRAKKRSNTHAR